MEDPVNFETKVGFMNTMVTVLRMLNDEEIHSKNKSIIMVGGEGDTNQTKFEHASNFMKIGVRAKEFKTRKALLFLLRVTYDKNLELIKLFSDWEKTRNKGGKKYLFRPKQNIKNLIEFMGNFESEYYSEFEDSPDYVAETELVYADKGMLESFTVSTRIRDMEIYDIPRLLIDIINTINGH